MTAWYDTLGKLTGEELYNLAGQLVKEMIAAYAVVNGTKVHWRKRQAIAETVAELSELHHDVIAQAARITVPMIEAQGIVMRARFARGHPVRVFPQS